MNSLSFYCRHLDYILCYLLRLRMHQLSGASGLRLHAHDDLNRQNVVDGTSHTTMKESE